MNNHNNAGGTILDNSSGERRAAAVNHGTSIPGPASLSDNQDGQGGRPESEEFTERQSHPYSSSTPNGPGSTSVGLPILSGPPPVTESDSCRTCDKYFIPLFRRACNCHFCGYQYCSDHCSEHSALLPRSKPKPNFSATGSGGTRGGYDVVPVCHQCYPMVQIATAPVAYLRSVPLKRLQGFIKAFNLGAPAASAIEKDDFVRVIVRSRDTRTGTMTPTAESFYRKRSVPNRGVLPPPSTSNGTRPGSVPNNTRPFTSTSSTSAGQSSGPRPPPSQPQYRPPPPSQQSYRPPPQPRPGPSSAARPAAPKSTPPKPTPPPPVPTLSSLVPLPFSYISTLSIGTLKAILYDNHVKVDFSQVLEKDELVKRVVELMRMERKRLERLAKEEEAEFAAAAAAARNAQGPGDSGPLHHQDEDPTSTAGDTEHDTYADPSDRAKPSIASVATPPPTGPPPSVERDGLCVVCQDEDAELAVVDCGHLSMCQACSKLVMNTTKECPLCRTRIVTEQRLIRIFRS